MTLSDKERIRIESYVAALTKDWPPPNKPEQLRVLRRIFGPRLRAEAEAMEKASVRTEVQLRDPDSYALPLLDRLEARRRAGFVGPTLTDGHVERFVDVLLSPPFAA